MNAAGGHTSGGPGRRHHPGPGRPREIPVWIGAVSR
jgi:hypothetical protein